MMIQSTVNLTRSLGVLLMLLPRLGPCLELSNVRGLSADLDRDEFFSVQVDAYGPNADVEAYDVTRMDLILLVVIMEGGAGREWSAFGRTHGVKDVRYLLLRGAGPGWPSLF